MASPGEPLSRWRIDSTVSTAHDVASPNRGARAFSALTNPDDDRRISSGRLLVDLLPSVIPPCTTGSRALSERTSSVDVRRSSPVSSEYSLILSSLSSPNKLGSELRRELRMVEVGPDSQK